MSTVQEIEAAIPKLSPSELRQFNEWGRLTDGQLAGIVQQVAGLAQEHTMLREAYIAHERACLTFLGRVRWLFRGRR